MSTRASPQSPPLVTVGMPVYNAGVHLRPAVQSIVLQTFCDWELLLIDDGSNDGAVEDLVNIHDPRIRILRDGHNTGIAVRLNQALDLARGRFFARMDADDVSFPERFAKQVALLQADRSLDLVATRAIMIDESNLIRSTFPYAITHDEICARPWLGFHFPHPTWMGKTEWFRTHRYSVPAPYLCEDQELLLRSYHTGRFATADAVLLAYRVKSTTDWRKLLKIRGAMIKCQLQYFRRSGQWHFAVLALMAWLAKTSRDAWKRWAGATQLTDTCGISADLEKSWHDVLRIVTVNVRST